MQYVCEHLAHSTIRHPSFAIRGASTVAPDQAVHSRNRLRQTFREYYFGGSSSRRQRQRSQRPTYVPPHRASETLYNTRTPHVFSRRYQQELRRHVSCRVIHYPPTWTSLPATTVLQCTCAVQYVVLYGTVRTTLYTDLPRTRVYLHDCVTRHPVNVYYSWFY